MLVIPAVGMNTLLVADLTVLFAIHELADVAAVMRIRACLEARHGHLEAIIPADLVVDLRHKSRFAVTRVSGHDPNSSRRICQLATPLGETELPNFHRGRLWKVE